MSHPTAQEKKRRAKRPSDIEAGPPRKREKKRRNFDEQCKALLVYKAENSHINVPSDYDQDRALGQWVKSTRRSRGTKLTPEQKARLAELGFDWETREEKEDKRWNAMLEKLQEYRRLHLDCCVPKGWSSDPQLGRWVDNQRQKDANNTLQPHHKQQLDEIGFRWSRRTKVKRDSSAEDEKWFEKYRMLAKYHEENGNCLVPRKECKSPDAELGKWVNWQRQMYKNGQMKEERKKWLDKIVFVYKVDKADPSASRTQKQWNKMFEHLVEFKEEHCHVDVKESFSKWGLGKWVSTQRTERRKGKLDQRRAVRLQAIGITWGNRHDARWEEGFVMLAKYQKTFGHCRVPACYGSNGSRGKQGINRNLSVWVRKQRAYQAKGALLPERKERLDAVGFPWKAVKSSRDVECPSSDDEEETSRSRVTLTATKHTETNDSSDESSDSEFQFEG